MDSGGINYCEESEMIRFSVTSDGRSSKEWFECLEKQGYPIHYLLKGHLKVSQKN